MSSNTVVLWLERASDGTASRAHLDGTLSRLESAGINVHKVVCNDADPDGRENTWRKAKRISHLVALGMKSASPGTVLFARFHPLLFPVQLAWRLRGGKTIVSFQGSLEDMKAAGNSWVAKLPIARSTSIRVLKLADRIIVGNPTLIDHVRELVPAKQFDVIPNGVFADEMASVESTERPRKAPYAVYVGNFSSWQGIDTLIRATESVHWPEDLPLVVVGDGAQRAIVESADSERVIWVGRKPSSVAKQWLAHAEFAFSLKRSDTPTAQFGYWPFKVLESAALGTPIIVSDALGMREAGSALGNAVIVPSEDPERAAMAAHELHVSPLLRHQLSEAGKAGINSYDWRAAAGQVREIYISLAEGNDDPRGDDV